AVDEVQPARCGDGTRPQRDPAIKGQLDIEGDVFVGLVGDRREWGLGAVIDLPRIDADLKRAKEWSHGLASMNPGLSQPAPAQGHPPRGGRNGTWGRYLGSAAPSGVATMTPQPGQTT